MNERENQFADKAFEYAQNKKYSWLTQYQKDKPYLSYDQENNNVIYKSDKEILNQKGHIVTHHTNSQDLHELEQLLHIFDSGIDTLVYHPQLYPRSKDQFNMEVEKIGNPTSNFHLNKQDQELNLVQIINFAKSKYYSIWPKDLTKEDIQYQTDLTYLPEDWNNYNKMNKEWEHSVKYTESTSPQKRIAYVLRTIKALNGGQSTNLLLSDVPEYFEIGQLLHRISQLVPLNNMKLNPFVEKYMREQVNFPALSTDEIREQLRRGQQLTGGIPLDQQHLQDFHIQKGPGYIARITQQGQEALYNQTQAFANWIKPEHGVTSTATSSTGQRNDGQQNVKLI